MKKYLLTKYLINELIYGSIEDRGIISNKLETLIQKNESLFVSILSLNQILENEQNLDKRKKILSNIKKLAEKILLVDTDDLPLALGLETEFSISHSHAVELIIAQKSGMDFILTTQSKKEFGSQKMISVIELILESK